jgi:lipooligosaccharide transport system ATP-binding protein
MTEPRWLIETIDLRKYYGGQAVVDGISFGIKRGECFGVLGPNGAGKTTTLRMILGVTPHSGGNLRVFGEPVVDNLGAFRHRIGVVPQQDNLDPDFTVEENLRVYGSYFGLSPALMDERVPRLLAFVELTDKAKARVPALSGGMKRRLTIARALINDPEFIILDEPTTGLDPQIRHLIWQRLRELLKQGKTLLLTTHYLEEAERLCDRLIVMDHGRVLDHGSPRELIARHIEAEVLEVQAELADVRRWLDADSYQRLETAGDLTFVYTTTAARCIEPLEAQSDLRFLRRRATLEDVFLKLTGRDLRE